MSNGRPTDFDDSYIQLAYEWCLLGATDEKLAEVFECDVATLNRWKLANTDFCASIKKGKGYADTQVAKALYTKATGYTKTEEKLFMYQGDAFKEEVDVYYPPDSTSMIFWLKNRQRMLWRDGHDINHSGSVAHSEMDLDQLEKRKAELEAKIEQQRTS